MPTGPGGQKRPADAIARAVLVAQIATGEADENTLVARDKLEGSQGKSQGASPSDRKGAAKSR